MLVVRLDPVSVDLATPALQDEHGQPVAVLATQQRPGRLALGGQGVHDHLAGMHDDVRDALEGSTVDLAVQSVDEVLRRVPVLLVEVLVLVTPATDGGGADLEPKSDLGDPEP